MNKNILLLGSTGKMGTALRTVLKDDYNIIGKNSTDFDALDVQQVRNLIEQTNPDIVINTVAYLGIDPCETEPEKAIKLNTIFPKFLAELSNEMGFLLIHFSTDAVFNDTKKDYYTEKDAPHPLNIYGLTKYGGDCFIQTIAKSYYIFRISVLFGETNKNRQFVEKILQKITDGEKVLKISSDIISSPSYSLDVAREIKKIVDTSSEYGIYHIANEGKASLYDLIKKIVEYLKLDIDVEKVSYNDFPYLGIKNTYTPIKSEKIISMRPWHTAVEEYCNNIKLK